MCPSRTFELQLRPGVNLGSVRLQDRSCLLHHVVDDRLRGQYLVDHCSDASDEESPSLETPLGVLLKLVLVWDDPLSSELLDLSLTLVVPRGSKKA